ncbi:MAG TPA: ABC transporter ATP-binding protein [Stellaceae bacterium]|nr:ABC transporter ATP-binding protein [Stellaceae bacterium]
MQAPRLEFRHVTKRFAKSGTRGEIVVAVADVSFAVADGEVVSLIGPSGCGKSTLLTLGSGLDAPSEGEVFVDGERVTRPNPHVAFMLQKDLLLPWRTIRENVEFGLEIQGVAAAQRRERSAALLATCRIADFAGHYPYQLSGGMRQRAALARTLAVDPTVLLLDEPFSALDAQTKMVLQQDLARTIRDAGKTALFITHDLVEAVALSDRVLVMSARPGRIIEEIAIDLPHRDDCMRRRELPGIGHYVPRLMSLLHVREAAV